MVPGVGFGPTRPCGQGILSPQRLPFRHPGGHPRTLRESTHRGESVSPAAPGSRLRPHFTPRTCPIALAAERPAQRPPHGAGGAVRNPNANITAIMMKTKLAT